MQIIPITNIREMFDIDTDTSTTIRKVPQN